MTKLVVFPLIVFAALSLIPVDAGTVAKNTTVLVMAMPSPAMAMILASRYRCDTGFAAL